MNIFRASHLLMNVILCIATSSISLVAMEAPIQIPAEFHMMFTEKTVIPRKDFIITGRGNETVEDAVKKALKKNRLKCSDFDTDPLEKEQTLIQARDRLAQLGSGRKLVIQCWSRKKTKKELPEEESEESIIIQVYLQGQRPISLRFPLDTAQEYEQTLKTALEQSFKQNRIVCSIDDIERIKIGQKKVWRRDHFLKKSLRKVKKQIGKEIITIECVPTEG